MKRKYSILKRMMSSEGQSHQTTFFKWKLSKMKTYILYALIFFSVTFIYYHFSLKTHAPYDDAEVIHNCDYYQKRMYGLVLLTQLVHDAFEKHGIPHFLLYGSLWGPLRGFNGPLPWDYDVDFATMYEINIDQKVKSAMKDLQKVGVKSRARPVSGSYVFKLATNEVGPQLDLFVFTKSWFGLARRVGLETYVFALHYYLHHSFPYKFAHGELPKVSFAGRTFQQPKGGIEIMKYLYRYNWNEVRMPKHFNCTIKYE